MSRSKKSVPRTDGLVLSSFSQRKAETDSSSNSGYSDEEEIATELAGTFIHVRKAVKLTEGEDVYPLRKGLKRGKMLIANFREFPGTKWNTRKGSEFDVASMKRLFSQIGNHE